MANGTLRTLGEMIEDMKEREEAGLPQLPPTPARPSTPTPLPISGTGDVTVPQRPTKWTKTHGNPIHPFSGQTRWGVGGPMIQQQKAADDPEKWEQNWQAGMPRVAQLSERSKRILRGEDPDGN